MKALDIAEDMKREIAKLVNNIGKGEKLEKVIDKADVIIKYRCGVNIATEVLRILEKLLSNAGLDAKYTRGKLKIKIEK
ncbi:MAG: hypothetical protein QXM07_09540 [Nitrososphaerota archaeon]